MESKGAIVIEGKEEEDLEIYRRNNGERKG